MNWDANQVMAVCTANLTSSGDAINQRALINGQRLETTVPGYGKQSVAGSQHYSIEKVLYERPGYKSCNCPQDIVRVVSCPKIL